MKTLTELLDSYQSYHTKKATKITHYIGIPLVAFSLLILFSWIQIVVPNVFHLNVSWIFVVLVLAYYYSLDIPLAIVATIIFVPLTFIANWLGLNGPDMLSGILFLVFFIGGWILQLVGHVFEGKRPALVDNFWQVFIAPLFLIHELFVSLGLHKEKSK